MDDFQNKYGIEEDQKVKDYHRSRRMFAIKDGKLHLADLGADYSHADWFRQLGWMTETDDSLMDRITRGAVESTGVYAYKGYDFIVDDQVRSEVLVALPQIVDELGLAPEMHVFGGKIIEIPGKAAVGREDMGTINELLKK